MVPSPAIAFESVARGVLRRDDSGIRDGAGRARGPRDERAAAVFDSPEEVRVMGWVKDILAAKGDQVHTISGSATAYEAADKMVRCNVGSLVVMEEGKVA